MKIIAKSTLHIARHIVYVRPTLQAPRWGARAPLSRPRAGYALQTILAEKRPVGARARRFRDRAPPLKKNKLRKRYISQLVLSAALGISCGDFLPLRSAVGYALKLRRSMPRRFALAPLRGRGMGIFINMRCLPPRLLEPPAAALARRLRCAAPTLRSIS